MPLKVSRLLELLKERGAKDEDYIFSLISAPPGFMEPDISPECACIGLRELIVPSDEIVPSPLRKDRPVEAVKIVVVIEAFRDLDYYNCLTVADLKRFLKNIKNTDEYVCLATPSEYNPGPYHAVINADKSTDGVHENEKMRDIVGGNVFHLWL